MTMRRIVCLAALLGPWAASWAQAPSPALPGVLVSASAGVAALSPRFGEHLAGGTAGIWIGRPISRSVVVAIAASHTRATSSTRADDRGATAITLAWRFSPKAGPLFVEAGTGALVHTGRCRLLDYFRPQVCSTATDFGVSAAVGALFTVANRFRIGPEVRVNQTAWANNGRYRVPQAMLVAEWAIGRRT